MSLNSKKPEEPPSLSANHWLILAISLTVIIAIAWLGVNAWLDYAKNSLLWDKRTTDTITYSALAIPFALMVWFGVNWINKMPDSVPELKRKTALQSLVVQPLAWSLLLLAYTFSEMREQWHVGREIYFTIGTAASAMMSVSYLVQYKLEREKVNIFTASIWALMFSVLLYRFFWTGPSQGIFG